MWISDHRVWTEIMKKKHGFVKESQYVRWLSEFQWYYSSSYFFFVSVCRSFVNRVIFL